MSQNQTPQDRTDPADRKPATANQVPGRDGRDLGDNRRADENSTHKGGATGTGGPGGTGGSAL
ncbi:hypothetical protein [Phenylobacterium sp.]|jgi:hypothetical protein|uniref:hypothetical protein n=1 Tax=Phenylobacterium sp. TaxID=1871053 RepID=UPI002FDA60FD